MEHGFNGTDISILDDTSYSGIKSLGLERLQYIQEKVLKFHVPEKYYLEQFAKNRVLRKLERAIKALRPLQRGDVVKLPDDTTGVVVRTQDSTVSVVLKGNKFGIWYQIKDVKRIGRVHNRRS